MPRLVGRTSSGTAPWWGLSYEDDSPGAGEQRWRDGACITNETAYGPVGPHKIRECWEARTLRRVQDALLGLDWTSIDVLRYGPNTLPALERQVIVWVGVRPLPAPPADENKNKNENNNKSKSKSKNKNKKAPGDAGDDERPRHDWALISAKLRAVREALDADGLTDVECEMRESEVALLEADAEATGSGSVDNTLTLEPPEYRTMNPPRLRLPLGRDQRLLSPELAAVAPVISTAVGQSIGPSSAPENSGTLGLYLGPADVDAHAGAGGEDGESPVCALTCSHVVNPSAASIYQAPESPDPNQAFNMDGTVVLPAKAVLERFDKDFGKLDRGAARLMENVRASIDEGEASGESKAIARSHFVFLESQRGLLDEFKADVESHTACPRSGRVAGKVFSAPPRSPRSLSSSFPEMIDRGTTGNRSKPPFCLDWALVTLWRSKFPVGYTFANSVDFGHWPRIDDYIAGYLKSFPGPHEEPKIDLTDNYLMRLRDETVPLSEMWAGGNGATSPFIVMKRGSTSGLSAGVVLDIPSVVRHQAIEGGGGGEMTRSELAIVELKRQEGLERFSQFSRIRYDRFSAPGDSGAAVFDPRGRICGMITSGAGSAHYETRPVDVTYTTPMEVLLPAIEKDVGMKLRIL